MKISTILDHIDSGHMALPEFQRGYVWNRGQVRGLMDSLYRRHPVGSLLVWATESEGAPHRGEGDLAPGVVKLLLDGQQRITSLYGIVRGKPPEFFDGNAQAFTRLHFHLGRQEFSFYQPVTMKDDPLWLDISELMRRGNDGLGAYVAELSADAQHATHVGDFVGRLSAILGIRDIDFHIDEVTGTDMTVDVVVDIFNRVNSGGTKLSKGDLALAKICADWPDGRKHMREAIARWREHGYQFTLDWFLRCVNTLVTGEAKFLYLHNIEASIIQDGVKRAERAIDQLLNMIGSRLGLDHDRVLFGKYALAVMAHYLDRGGGKLADARERDRLLYWYLQAAMWGRFSGSTESFLDQDLKLIEELDGGLDRLINTLRLWHGGLRVQPGHFSGWSLGARFYPVLYMLTRVGSARDWGDGGELKSSLLGKMSQLEVHHIFPKALLYKHGYGRAEVNAVANFCFLTKQTNLRISDRAPEEYFVEVEEKWPGALASQWIPMVQDLWEVDHYADFLEARRTLLADAANEFLAELLGEEEATEELLKAPIRPLVEEVAATVPGGVDDVEEERVLNELNRWIVAHGLPEGEYLYELAHQETGDPLAVLDLAWPEGLQQGLSDPVAVLLNEGTDTLAAANAAGFRYFTDAKDFRRYVEDEVLGIRDSTEIAMAE